MNINMCTCDFIVDPFSKRSIVMEPCEFCTTMIWAAKLEAKIRRLPTQDDLDEKLDKDELAHEMESEIQNLSITGFVREDDFDDMVEKYLKDADILERDDVSNFVSEDDLSAKVQETIEELDLVRDIAAGAAEGAAKESR